MTYILFNTTSEDLTLPTKLTFIMSPYTIHLVLTFTSKTHGRIKLLHYELMDMANECFDCDRNMFCNVESSRRSAIRSKEELKVVPKDIKL